MAVAQLLQKQIKRIQAYIGELAKGHTDGDFAVRLVTACGSGDKYNRWHI